MRLLTRLKRYVREIRNYIKANSASRFKEEMTTGYIVADSLEKNPIMISEIKSMGREGMYASDWHTLLENAKYSWKEFLEILVDRGRGDERLKSLIED